MEDRVKSDAAGVHHKKDASILRHRRMPRRRLAASFGFLGRRICPLSGGRGSIHLGLVGSPSTEAITCTVALRCDSSPHRVERRTAHAEWSSKQIPDREVGTGQIEQLRQLGSQPPVVMGGHRKAALRQLLESAKCGVSVGLLALGQPQIHYRPPSLKKRAVLSGPECLHHTAWQSADDWLQSSSCKISFQHRDHCGS